MEFVGVESYDSKEVRAAERVMDSLLKAGGRLNEHYAAERRHQRTSYRSQVRIRIKNETYNGEADAEPFHEFSVYSPDLSGRGLSFIYPGELGCETICVGLPKTNGDLIWFTATIVRSRKTMEPRFWEYGVRFEDRLSESNN